MKKYIYLIIASGLLIGCGEEEHEEASITNAVEEELPNPERVEKTQQIFKTIPSPLETVSIFQEAGTVFNGAITNAVDNVNKYATNYQKAINLGIYGADLSYVNIFNQSQECMLYMNCCRILADGLGITSAFDNNTAERVEKNMNIRDSLIVIINDAFWIADAQLKENGQNHLSSLIITGGWIEGLYLGTSSLDKNDPDKMLMQRIADQKYSLNNLIELLATYDNDEINKVKQQIEPLKTAFDKIETIEAEASVSNTGGVATIGGGTTLKYEVETIIEITNIIDKIRNDIIQ